MSSTQGSPLAPLKKGGNGLKVPLLKGDLGGSVILIHRRGLLKHPLKHSRHYCGDSGRDRVYFHLESGNQG
jgi:hypothetical protein